MTKTADLPPPGDDPLSLSTLLDRAAGMVTDLGRGFDHYSRRLTNLKDRFSEGRFHLAVLGQFKRGKSTLLNALAGEPILPMGVIPLTAVPTFIQFGKTPKIRVQYQDGRPADEFTGASTDERNAYLSRFVTETGNPQNKNGVTEVEVSLPAPILADGVVMIDTPGIGSTFRHNTAATLNFLQQCDAALFLISADPPITEVEIDFLRQVREKIPRLFLVLNKIDYLDANELEEALSFYRRTLVEQAGWGCEFDVFCVSARTGLEAKTAGDNRKWIDSGMHRLESFLTNFLAMEKRNALIDAISRKAADLINDIQMEARIALKVLQLPRQELEEKISQFEESLKRAEAERKLIQDVLEGDKKRVTVFVEEEAGNMRKEAEGFLRNIANLGTAKTDIQRAWADAIPGFFARQQESLNDRVKANLLECLAPHEQRLARLLETLRQTAADLFQVPYRPFQQEEALETRSRPYWVLNTWNTDPLPILKSTEQRMDELVRRNVENIRWSMLQNLNVSFAGFARRARERLDETVSATRGAMASAHARRQDHGESIASEVTRMGERIADLDLVKADFAVFITD